MLLKEDGHLDIERVKMLNEEQLEEEMGSWGEDQWYEWDTKDGVMSVEKMFDYLRQKIHEYYAQINEHNEIEEEK